MKLYNTPHNNCSFSEVLFEQGLYPLIASDINILQMNITRQCNLSCKHCHVTSSPSCTEKMSRETLNSCIKVANHPAITTIDITGGAPEMHPDIEWLIIEMSRLNKRLLLRSNLVILLDPKYRKLINFFAEHKVEIVASLPDYREDRSDRQRGKGIYRQEIEVIRQLNRIGYGVSGSGLVLDLVHNPSGAYLPGTQFALETEYRRVLLQEHDVTFNKLFCIVNCPIGRYLQYLKDSDNLEDYMHTLRNAFNPVTTSKLMCRTMISVGWDGRLFDCDFNFVQDMTVNSGSPIHINEFDYKKHSCREINIADHCFACTAGAGSSCQGALRTDSD